MGTLSSPNYENMKGMETMWIIFWCTTETIWQYIAQDNKKEMRKK